MRPIHLLAVLPFIGMLIGPILHNKMYPLIMGMPFSLGWITAWVILTAIIMAIIYHFDPANAEDDHEEPTPKGPTS
ncbi:MAG: DUF3311 domain-containing protein [Acetobacteraceae bacterium]